MQKIGITFSGETTISDVLRRSKFAEKSGMHSVWVAEHYFNREAFSTISAISAVTEKITLGTGIVSPYTRHIALLAMSAMTVSEMSYGRFILGLGTNARFLKRLGIDDNKPIRDIRRAVTTLNTLFSSGEANLGEIYGKGETAKLGFTSGRQIPIYIGAIGPRMCRLAGEIASGAILSVGCTPGYIEKAVGWMKEGHGGSLPKGFEVAGFIMATKNNEQGRRTVRERLVHMLSLPGREVMAVGTGSDDLILKIRKAFGVRDLDEAISLVSDDMVEHTSISGSNEECREKLEEFRKAGITLPVISPMGEGTDELLSTFAGME